MGATPSDCAQVTGKQCSQDAGSSSQCHELQRTSTRFAAAGSALAIVGAMQRRGDETELAAVILIVMSLGLEVLAALRRRSYDAGKLQHSVLERYKDPLFLWTLCPAMLTMMLFTAWGPGAIRHFSIVPRSWEGLQGVFLGCFVHFSWSHCLWNVLALGLLAPCVLGAGVRNLLAASAFIAVTSGFCVWCMARPALHAGASGVVCGYLGMLTALMFRRRDVPLCTLLTVFVVVACYSGALLMHGTPFEPLYEACRSHKTSAEHHTFGFLSGLVFALLFVRSRPHAQ